jgi:glutamyl-tRNA synthetase
VQRKAAVFDPQKLKWMNGEHLRALGASVVPLFRASLAGVDPVRIQASVAAVLPRSWTTLDVERQVRVRLGLDPAKPDETAVAYIAKDPAGYRAALEVAAQSLREASDWSAAGLDAHLRQLAKTKGMKVGALMQPIRIALTGGTVSEAVNELLALIGRDESLRRLAETSP